MRRPQWSAWPASPHICSVQTLWGVDASNCCCVPSHKCHGCETATAHQVAAMLQADPTLFPWAGELLKSGVEQWLGRNH
eukprot:3006566-Amphidinium_carterae.1